MSVSRRDLLIAGAALPVTGLWLSNAFGQDRPPAVTGGTPAGLAEDPLLAAELLICGRKQIASGQVALRQTQNGDVRAFAEAEVAEHQTLQLRLSDRGYQYPGATAAPAAAAGGAPVNAVPGIPGNPPTEPTANRPAVPPPGTRPAKNAEPPPVRDVTSPPLPASRNATTPIINVGRAQLPVESSRLILIDTQVGEQCVATFAQEVGSLTGLAFDKAYVSCQLFEHYGLLDRATVFRRHASPTLLPVLDEALPVIQRHIGTLKALIGKLEATR